MRYLTANSKNGVAKSCFSAIIDLQSPFYGTYGRVEYRHKHKARESKDRSGNMNYIVLDLEWNQLVSAKSMVRTPVSLYGEIIQIGAVKLDENYHILDTFKIMVPPKHYRKMYKKVTKLTKITTEDLQYGFPFPVAFKYFKKWCGDEFAFLTWGPDDVGILNDNMVLHKLDTALIPNTYNIQVIFDNQITQEKRQVSLSYAMEKLGEPALEAHDALHDQETPSAFACIWIWSRVWQSTQKSRNR